MLKNLNTGTTTTRNERVIRKFPGDANQTADTQNIPADTDKVITGIMKQGECMKTPESLETADITEQLAHGESSESSINPAHTDNTEQSSLEWAGSNSVPTHLGSFEDQACSLKAHGPITWAKTVQVIYFQEPQVQSVQKLFHHFATRPRHNEHMGQHQEENANKTSKGRQKEGSRSL